MAKKSCTEVQFKKTAEAIREGFVSFMRFCREQPRNTMPRRAYALALQDPDAALHVFGAGVWHRDQHMKRAGKG